MYDGDASEVEDDHSEMLLTGGASNTNESNAMGQKKQHTSNMGSLKRGMYMISCLVSVLFLCSSIFAFLTSREIIFPERTAPKYIFDMFQLVIFLVFVTIWV